MEWFYAKDSLRQGPVGDAEFEGLIGAGAITPETLVWRAGMPNWQPLVELRPETAQLVPCAECGKRFPSSDVIQFEGGWVCAPCKPVFLQKLKEGVTAAGLVGRSGRQLVMARSAALPDRCVKCNAPADGRRLTRKLYWHHPWLYLLVLVSILIYAIVALIVRKRARIDIGLCARHDRARRRAAVIAWLVGLSGLAMVVGSVALESGWFALWGILAALGGLIYGNFACRMVYARRIDDQHVWLGGVAREYLEDLPEARL